MSIEPVKILALGDIMMGEHPGSLGLGVLSKWKQTKTDPLSLIEHFVKKHHLVVGNLECVLSSTTDKSGYQRASLRAPPSLAHYLAMKGIHVLSVANNHAMDHGYNAFEETVSSLENAGIFVCGTGNDPVRMEVSGSQKDPKRTVSFFGISFRPNDTNFEPSYTHIANKEDFENIKSKIYQEKKQSDLIVVQCHWGDEFVSSPSVEQVRLANELVKSGADIIIGHHSHVYQGLWTIRSCPVFFSLGNFVSDMREGYLRKSAIGSIVWEHSKLTSTSIPIRLNNHHQPYLSNESKDWDYIKSIDKQRGVIHSTHYSSYYKKTLQRARLRYKIDTLLNLVKSIGVLPKWRFRMLINALFKYATIS